MDDLSPEQVLALVDLDRLPVALVLAVVGWLALAAATRLLDDLGERFTDRRLYLKRVKALLRFFVYLVAAVLVPVLLLRDTGREALLPLVGAFTFGLGFALKDLASSLVSGVLLLVDEPFQVGDRIAFAGYYGEVTEIGLRSVRLVTLDDNLVTIPNGKFLTDEVASANAGALDCMVVVPFYLPPAEDFDRARRIVQEVAATSRYVFLDKPIATTLEQTFLGERFVLIVSVKAYVFDARFEKAFSADLTARTVRAFRAAGIRGVDQAYRDLDVARGGGVEREGSMG